MTFSVQFDSLFLQEVMRLRRILSPAPTGHWQPSTGRLPSKEGLQGSGFAAFLKCREATPLIAERSDSDAFILALCSYIIERTKVRAPKRGPGQWRPFIIYRPLFPL